MFNYNATATAYANAANAMVAGADGENIGKLFAVATALADGTMYWDAEAADGKGQYKGGTALANACREACDNADRFPTGFKGQISKICSALAMHPLGKVKGDEARYAACVEWVAAYGSPLQFGEKAERKADTLAKIVADALRRTGALGLTVEQLIEALVDDATVTDGE